MLGSSEEDIIMAMARVREENDEFGLWAVAATKHIEGELDSSAARRGVVGSLGHVRDGPHNCLGAYSFVPYSGEPFVGCKPCDISFFSFVVSNCTRISRARERGLDLMFGFTASTDVGFVGNLIMVPADFPPVGSVNIHRANSTTPR